MYYLHVNVPEDELIQDAINAEEAQPAQDGPHIPETILEESTKVIGRKPLPPKPAAALIGHPRSPADGLQNFRPALRGSGETDVTRKPPKPNVQQSKEIYGDSPPLPRRPPEVPPTLPTRKNAETLMPPLPPRRLQGPRPLHSRNESVDTATLGRDLRKENMNPRRFSEQLDAPEDRGARPLSVQNCSGEVSELTVAENSEQSFLSITLIRRDPSTGEQWNVGRITSGPTSSVGFTVNHKSKGLQDEVLIELDTPGYQAFYESRPPYNGPFETNNSGSNVFRQSLHLGKPRAVVKTPSPQRSEFGLNVVQAGNRPSLESSRSYSQASYPNNEDDSVSTQHYSFLSPWHGKCTFSTSATGKSIKCRHMLPSRLRQHPNNVALDPSGLPVSELRFNLPTSNAFKPRIQDHKRPILSKFSRSAGSDSHLRLPSHPHNGMKASLATANEDISSEEDKMDLSLGQERAGGGFGGKKAKLGKLILEREGLKMLDLLVAVNMAIWWKVYE